MNIDHGIFSFRNIEKSEDDYSLEVGFSISASYVQERGLSAVYDHVFDNIALLIKELIVIKEMERKRQESSIE